MAQGVKVAWVLPPIGNVARPYPIYAIHLRLSILGLMASLKRDIHSPESAKLRSFKRIVENARL